MFSGRYSHHAEFEDPKVAAVRHIADPSLAINKTLTACTLHLRVELK